MIKANIVKAYTFAEKAHEGVERKFSGLPYFSHPKGVARIVADIVNDETLIVASFLHDVVEDTNITLEEIEKEFGVVVSKLVSELTSEEDGVKKLSKKIYVGLKMSNMSSDALIIKLADRLHNILYLQGDNVPTSFIEKYYKETRFIMHYLKEEYSLLGDKHLILIGKIDAVLDFLQIRHKY